MTVPSHLRDGERQRVTVGRCWPQRRRESSWPMRIEGRDDAGRLRAGEMTMTPTGRGWQVASTRLLSYAEDPRLPGLAGVARTGELLVHRPGRRAVVRGEGHYLKVVRPDAADRLVAATSAGQALARRAGWEAPSARRTDGWSGSVQLSVVPGRTLHEVAGQGCTPQVVDAWAAFADGWPRVVSATDLDLPAHTAADEAKIVSEWVERATHLIQGIGPEGPAGPAGGLVRGLRQRGAEVREALLAAPGRPLRPAHRDLHDKQVLSSPQGGLGILDLDTAALAEVELDLANLAEHLVLRGRQGLWPAASVDHGLTAIGAVLDLVGADEARFAAYRAATCLRLSCLYLFRPRWSLLAQEWLASLAESDENGLIGASSPRHAATRGSSA